MRDSSRLRKPGRSGKFARILAAALALCACGASSYRDGALAQVVPTEQIDADMAKVESPAEDHIEGAHLNMFVDVDVDAVDDLITQL
jgi:hypothetical protein